MEPVDENVSDDENKTTTAENESDEENESTIVENHFINKYALVDGNINEWVLAVEEVEAEVLIRWNQISLPDPILPGFVNCGLRHWKFLEVLPPTLLRALPLTLQQAPVS